MGDRLIIFETAKLAKEKGFFEKCDKYYDNGGVPVHTITKVSNQMRLIAIPTQTALQKWLRETHFLQVGVDRDEDYWTPKLLEFRHGNKYKAFPIMSESYETAMETGLQEALKLIVCKKN